MLLRRLFLNVLIRGCQNPTVQKKVAEVAGKALYCARPSLLLVSRRAGELTKKAVKKLRDVQ